MRCVAKLPCWQRYDRGILFNSHLIFFIRFVFLRFVSFCFRPLSTQLILFPTDFFFLWPGIDEQGTKFALRTSEPDQRSFTVRLVSCLVWRGPYISGSNFLSSFIQRLDMTSMVTALSGLSHSSVLGQYFEYPTITIQLMSYLAATFGMPWKEQH